MEFAVAVNFVRPVERHLRRAGRAQACSRPDAVVVVEAFAGHAVIRVVVVGLIGHDRLLVQDVRAARIIPHGENDVVLKAVGIRELREKDAAGPGRWHS